MLQRLSDRRDEMSHARAQTLNRPNRRFLKLRPDWPGQEVNRAVQSSASWMLHLVNMISHSSAMTSHVAHGIRARLRPGSKNQDVRILSRCVSLSRILRETITVMAPRAGRP